MARARTVFGALALSGSLFLAGNLSYGTLVQIQSSDASEPDSSRIPSYFLREIVVTANRYERNSFEVPQAISIATREDMEAKAPQSIFDVLRGMAGVEASDAGPFRTRPVIRGMFGSRVLVLIDGEAVNNSRESTFSGAELSLLDVGQVERIEVVHGPGSVLYDSDALGGVINIITRRPAMSGRETSGFVLGGALQLGYSTAGNQGKVRLQLDGKARGLDFVVGGSIRKASDYDSPQGMVINSALGQAGDVNLKANYTLSGGHRLGLDCISFKAEDIGYPGTPSEEMPELFFPIHARDKIAVDYEARNLTPRLPSLKTTAYYQNIEKEFDSDLTTPINPWMDVRSFSRTFSDVKKYGFNLQQLFLTSKDQFSTMGIDYYREVTDGNRVSETTMLQNDTTVVFYAEDRTSTVPENTLDALGIFLTNELRLLDRSIVTLGLRYEHSLVRTKETPDYVDTRLSPPVPFEPTSQHLSSLDGNLGAVYDLSKQVHLVGNVATGFRAPNVVERYFFGRASGSEFVIPNYDLAPEKSINLDLGAKVNAGRFFASLTFFHSWLRDFIELQATGDSVEVSPGEFLDEWHYINITEARMRGIEVEIKGTLPRNFFGFLTMTYTRGDNVTLDQPIFVAPFNGTLGFGWKEKNERVRIGADVRYVASQERVPKDSNGEYLDRLPTPSFTVINLESSVRLFNRHTLALRVKNLANKTYSEPYNATNPYNPVVEPGRNLVLSLSAAF